MVRSFLKQPGIVLGSLRIEMNINQSQLSQPWEKQADKTKMPLREMTAKIGGVNNKYSVGIQKREGIEFAGVVLGRC